MKKSIILVSLITTIIISFAIIYFPQSQTKDSSNSSNRENDSMREYNNALRIQQEYLMLRDPVSKRIPNNIRNLELQFAETLPKNFGSVLYKGIKFHNTEALTWTERGPNNIGGRVRALGMDIRETGTPTILTGGASGGIWKSTNGGANWSLKTSASTLHSVTCIAQDTRSGSEDTWYYGTGENIGNSAAADGAPYLGNGIFKSVDNGETWTQLTATSTADNTQWTSDWQYVFNIAVHPTSGNIYAATTGGVYRSTDGGTSWTKVLDPGNGNTLRTDVTIAANGTVYAASSSNSGNIAGIRKSTDDGDNWSNVSPTLPDTYSRTIIKTAPSNSDYVYFFTEGVSGNNNTPNANNHQLWKSTNAGTGWTNISSVVPGNTSGDGLDDLSTQNGYDMLLAIKPDNPDFVIVGGVSIFKIPDVTNDNQTLVQKHIGGYGISGNGTANDLGDFINHHPDSHIGVFKPGSNIIFYTGNDGGISYTNDITGDPTSSFWQTPLRSGFNVSQLYSASLDKTNGSGFIAGGFQDRGNWMSRTTGATQDWQEVSGGDGAFAEIDPSGTYVFMSTTEGSIFRFDKSDNTSPIAAAVDLKPANLSNPLFITPFDVDDNSGDIIYFSGGNSGGGQVSGIWRTNNATSGTPSWSFFANSEITGDQVSALAVSNSNSSNVLYYGSAGGKLYRIDNANSADVSTTNPTDITGGSFPTGYVSSIAIDPANSANVFVTFSNYNVDRLWYSTNSGGSWTSVTGNLTGANSPSIRWAEIFTISGVVHYFIATSTGVYYTVNLNGGSTVWTQEAVSSIGNVVTTMLDFRPSDGKLIAATHGRGVFETTIASPLPVEITMFSGTLVDQNVLLLWETSTEMNNYGFEIERRYSINYQYSSWNKIGFVNGNGTTNSPKEYSFIDSNLPNTDEVNYRLKQIDNDGSFTYSKSVSVDLSTITGVDDENIPTDFKLDQNYPNPFNPSTKIKFSVPHTANVVLNIYNTNGELVKTLINEQLSTGIYEVVWDSRNTNGVKVASGIYFYSLKSSGFSQTKKMMLLK